MSSANKMYMYVLNTLVLGGVQIMHEAENLDEKDEHLRDEYFGDEEDGEYLQDHETTLDEGSDEL